MAWKLGHLQWPALLVFVGMTLLYLALGVRRRELPPLTRSSEHDHNLPDFAIQSQIPSWAWCDRAVCGFSRLHALDSDPRQANPERYSQDGQEDWLSDYAFYKQGGGFFLELGALDGTRYSNTKWLAKAAGWRGLLIEASPVSYQALVRDRPESICINAAICSEFQQVHFVDSSIPEWDAVDGIWEFMTDGFRKQWYPNWTDASVAQDGLKVTCLPLSWLLKRLHIDKVDVWFLDVEGAEEGVLRTFDFDAVQVDVVIIEQDGHTQEGAARINALVESKGFERVCAEERNTYWVRREAQGALRAAPGKTLLPWRGGKCASV